MIVAVVLALAAIVVPFGLHGAHRGGAEASTGARVSTAVQTTSPHQVDTRSGGKSELGPQGDLPPLMASGRSGIREGLRDGAGVRVGDITEGTLRRTTEAGWQVVVLWDGYRQPLTTRGPVSLGARSWVSASGLLYTRVPTGTPGRFHVYAWDPEGGTAYTPPTLVAADLGRVCFNASFTAFGNCRTSG